LSAKKFQKGFSQGQNGESQRGERIPKGVAESEPEKKEERSGATQPVYARGA